jgi:hypothetical protein
MNGAASFLNLPLRIRLSHLHLQRVSACALAYHCTRPSANSVRGLKLLVYEALSY